MTTFDLTHLHELLAALPEHAPRYLPGEGSAVHIESDGLRLLVAGSAGWPVADDETTAAFIAFYNALSPTTVEELLRLAELGMSAEATADIAPQRGGPFEGLADILKRHPNRPEPRAGDEMRELRIRYDAHGVTITTEYAGPPTRGIPDPVPWTGSEVRIADFAAEQLGMTVKEVTSSEAGSTGPRVYRDKAPVIPF